MFIVKTWVLELSTRNFKKSREGSETWTLICKFNFRWVVSLLNIPSAEGNVDEMNASYQNETKVKVSV